MIWKHDITAGHTSLLEPNHKVFGNEGDGFFIITGYYNGSHWMMKVVDACAMVHARNLEPILTHVAQEMCENPSKWRYASDIWPEHYVQVELLSPCCSAKLFTSRGDGVMIGSCSKCHENIVRMNPMIGLQEWLDGKSPWTEDVLRPVAVAEKEAVVT